MGPGEGEKQNQIREQGVKSEASLLKIYIVFIYISPWFMQDNGSFSVPREVMGLLVVTKPKVNPRCIR